MKKEPSTLNLHTNLLNLCLLICCQLVKGQFQNDSKETKNWARTCKIQVKPC